jgi:hypothetical protein
MRSRHVLALVAILLAAAAAPPPARADVVPASSCSAPDVQAALDAAQDGDVVEVPPGTCTWTQTVSITRTVHLKGAGAGSTRITKTGGHRALVVAHSSHPDHLLRISHLGLNGQDGATCIYWQVDQVPRFRIDHNGFERCRNRAIEIFGYHSGVIDHNDFLNNGPTDVVVYGDDAAGWERPIVLGDDDAVVFVEDNAFTYTLDGVGAEHAIASNTGARYVFRHNTIDAEFADDMHVGAPIDAHGHCFHHRGTVSYEIYGNTIRSARSFRGMFLRGGTGVVYDNVFAEPEDGCALSSCYGIAISLTNYRSCQTCTYGGACSSYPCLDQIHDLYIWNNTYQGTEVAPEVASCASSHVVHGRDYFTAAMPGYAPYPHPHPLTLPDGGELGDVPDGGVQDAGSAGAPDGGPARPSDGGEVAGDAEAPFALPEDHTCLCHAAGARTRLPWPVTLLGVLMLGALWRRRPGPERGERRG